MMFKKAKFLTLSLITLALSSSVINQGLVKSDDNQDIAYFAVETNSSEEFINELTTYDWASNDYTFDLTYDVDFADFDATTTSGLTLEASSDRYTFNGNGHKMMNKEQNIPLYGETAAYADYHVLSNANVSDQYLFSTISNVDFYDIDFDNFLFFAETSTSNTFTNIAFENSMLSSYFLDKSTSPEESIVGIWNKTMIDNEINNLVISDVSLSNGIINVPSNSDVIDAYTNDLYLAPIAEVQGSLLIDGLFLDNISFESLALSNNNNNYFGKIMLSSLYAKGDNLTTLDISNAYIGSTSFKRITAFDRLQDKNYALIGGYSNSLTDIMLDDIVIDSDLNSDITTDTNQRYINFIETSFEYDASEIYVSLNDQITFYSDDNNDNFNIEDNAQFIERDEIYKSEFLHKLLGDTTFMLLENNQNPRAIIDSVEVQVIAENQKPKFATVKESIDYEAKTLFNSKIDNGNYKIAIANSKSKLLAEDTLAFDGTVSGTFNKINDKNIVVWDNDNEEIIFSQLIWESNALYVLWIILILLALIVLIIVLIIILLMLKRSKESKYVKAYAEELGTEIQLFGEDDEFASEHEKQLIIFDPTIGQKYDDDYGYGNESDYYDESEQNNSEDYEQYDSEEEIAGYFDAVEGDDYGEYYDNPEEEVGEYFDEEVQDEYYRDEYTDDEY